MTRSAAKVWQVAVLGMVAAGAALFGCGHKVPLTADFGTIDFGSAHWFANEQVAYVFFSLSERSSRLVHSGWQMRWSATSADGGVEEHAFAPIDFNQGVHEHLQLPCGANRICSSFSFRSARPVNSVDLKFLYDADSPTDLQKSLDVAKHAAGTSSDAFSALAYGVFDEPNSHMQVRIHHNFGSPQDELVPTFGLVRRFHANSVVLHGIDTVTVRKAQSASATPLLYPASFCAGQTGSDDLRFAGTSAWFNGSLDKAQGQNGACFQIEALDKQGVPLPSGVQNSFGRRNPEISNPIGPTILTPLTQTTQIPIAVRICPDDPAAGSMVDEDFFFYQEFILGMSRRPTDLCFRIGKESVFAKDFAAMLASRLADARSKATTSNDYLFVVALHELFTSEFTQIQSSISSALYNMINAEAHTASPRLVGAFVYDSTVNFVPTATQRQSIIWCPQTLLPQVLSPQTAPLADQNCTITAAAELDLQLINFVAPLGPLPSVSVYRDYMKKYGDKGLAHNPSLQLYSVPTGVNTLNEASKAVTYFDHERFVINAGEAARMCPEREDKTLASFRIRTATQADDVAGTSVGAINKLWLSADAPGEYRIGIAWDYPFWGGINYKAALTGKIASVVPYQKSSSAYEALGDQKWSTGSWDFGKYTQRCTRYCDNPFFDATGTYQASETWRNFQENSCPNPVYPQPSAGGT